MSRQVWTQCRDLIAHTESTRHPVPDERYYFYFLYIQIYPNPVLWVCMSSERQEPRNQSCVTGTNRSAMCVSLPRIILACAPSTIVLLVDNAWPTLNNRSSQLGSQNWTINPCMLLFYKRYSGDETCFMRINSCMYARFIHIYIYIYLHLEVRRRTLRYNIYVTFRYVYIYMYMHQSSEN